MAQDITIAVAGPMTGSNAAFGTQMKNGAEQFIADFNAGRRLMGKKLKLEVGDDACDPKQAASVAEKLAGMKIPFVAGHFCSVVLHPGLGSLCREQRSADHARLDQSPADRAQAGERVPGLRP